MNLSNQIKPISDLKSHTAEIVRALRMFLPKPINSTRNETSDLTSAKTDRHHSRADSHRGHKTQAPCIASIKNGLTMRRVP